MRPTPLNPHRLVISGAAPLARAIGLELLEWGGGRARTRMAASPRTARSETDARPDPLSLLAALDHSFSYALGGVIPGAAGLATLDMRADFGADPAAGEVEISAEVTMLQSQAGAATALARDAAGEVVAAGSATFRIGLYPGGATTPAGDIGRYDPSGECGPFRRLIGLEGGAAGPKLAANAPAAIGWESGRAIHGGAIAALLMAACETQAPDGGARRVASIAFRYLRPGDGGRELFAEARPDRIGRAAMFVDAVCFHDREAPVARAWATLVGEG